MTTYTAEQFDGARKKLAECATLQTALWDASLELERILGFDVDTADDLQETDIETLIAANKFARRHEVIA